MKFTLEFIISRRLLIPLYIPKNTLVREKYEYLSTYIKHVKRLVHIDNMIGKIICKLVCIFTFHGPCYEISFRIDKIKQQYQFTNVSKVYKPVHHKVELNLIDLEPDVEYDK